MDNKLSREEVLRVAKLAKLELTEAEIEKARVELFQLIHEIDKIKDVEVSSSVTMIAPFFETVQMKNDSFSEVAEASEIMAQAPAKSANMIEVPVMINE